MTKKQLELDFDKGRPPKGGIDQQEFAEVLDASGENSEYVLGTYDEIEYYCDRNNSWVNKYLDYVAPSTVRQGFKYVGSGPNPYELQRGFNYDISEKIIDDSF